MNVAKAIERIFRAEAGQVLATLIRQVGELALAEDALQDALEVALLRWPEEGLPSNPGAWLTITARRKALDRLRRRSNAKRLQSEVEAELRLAHLDEGRPDHLLDAGALPDDQLRLLFTCCHPALSPPSQVGLTLRTLGGLSTAEIARAFLEPEATTAQRLVRAKQKIQRAKIPYEIPGPELWPSRLTSVLAVLYLIFNEGYFASSGAALVRRELSAEAIRLAQLLHQLLPTEPEVAGLLALMLLHDARRLARAGDDGSLVLLEEQDRTRWDQTQIRRGLGILETALRRGQPGPYQIQAAIAALHAEAQEAKDTDWRQIMLLYDSLHVLEPVPIVALNRAVAAGMAVGPEVGLELLRDPNLSEALASYPGFHLARADLLRRGGQNEAAAQAYTMAATHSDSEVVRSFVARRLRELGVPDPP